MADSTASTACALCGGPLDEHDLDRGTCHDCRSPKGKIADLDIAIRASSENPNRISDWPMIRHLLRNRFGEDRSDTELWERCTDWLRAEGRLASNDYLPLPLNYLQWLLEHGFPCPDQQQANQKEGALRTFQRELENWNHFNSPSETGYVVEDVPVGHPLHAAVVALQPFYEGALPKPALGHWRTFLKLAIADDEAAEGEADRLLEWLNGEIQRHAQSADLGSNLIAVTTAGDLWKAYFEGKQPCFQSSGSSIRPGANTPTLACPDDVAEAKRTALDRAEALVTAEGGDKAVAMGRLIARLQLHAGMDKASVINMSLADFVAGTIGRGAATESHTGANKAGEALSQETSRHRDVIEKLERKTPQLDTESVEWIAARKENQKKFNLPIKTLRNYRAPSKGGRKKPDKMFGIDRDGRRWRRQGTPGSMVYYYVPSLPKSVE